MSRVLGTFFYKTDYAPPSHDYNPTPQPTLQPNTTTPTPSASRHVSHVTWSPPSPQHVRTDK